MAQVIEFVSLSRIIPRTYPINWIYSLYFTILIKKLFKIPVLQRNK
jgi:hypothetical protein